MRGEIKFDFCSECQDGKIKPLAHIKLKLCLRHFRIRKTKQQIEKYRQRSEEHWKTVGRTEQRPRPIIRRKAGSDAADNKWYRDCWAKSAHVCEECGLPLGDELRHIFVSHILTKGAHPELRRHPENFNILCPKDHHTWEFGERKSMNIYAKNRIFMNRFSIEKTT